LLLEEIEEIEDFEELKESKEKEISIRFAGNGNCF
jgi:hypothetical protein